MSITRSCSSFWHAARSLRSATGAVAVSLVLGAAAQAQVVVDIPTTGEELALQALGLIGVPYRFGGGDPARGLDCSGLVRYVFRAAAGVELPPRSYEIGRVGLAVAADELAVGDLVFFNTLGERNSHVGLYIGDGRFLHAPARHGRVRIESLQTPYWRARFDGARRLLGAVVAAVSGEPEGGNRGLSTAPGGRDEGP